MYTIWRTIFVQSTKQLFVSIFQTFRPTIKADMKVIVVGFPKTGTKSMAAALTYLDYTVYDILEHFLHHGKQWNKLLNEGGCVKDFKEMYEDVDVVVDAPALYFWEEIFQAFPNAKIILNVREELSWFASWKKQINQDNITTGLKVLETFSLTGWFYHKFVVDFQRVIHGFRRSYFPWEKIVLNEMVQRRNYRQHNAYVIQNAPKEQLLVYKVGEGWEPLCRFLGKDIPDTDFPYKNKNASFYEDALNNHPLMKKMKKETLISLVVLSSIGIFCGYKMIQTGT